MWKTKRTLEIVIAEYIYSSDESFFFLLPRRLIVNHIKTTDVHIMWSRDEKSIWEIQPTVLRFSF